MSAPLEALDLLLYCVQQLGIMMGVGGEIVVLVLYLLAIRDSEIDEKEVSFARALKFVVNIGLFLIIASGAAITYIHFVVQQEAVVLEPAYVFKWCLIGVVFLLAFINRSLRSSGFLEGVAGCTWLALFVIHILAPVTTYIDLIVAYALWMSLAVACWMGATFAISNARGLSQKTPRAEVSPEPMPVAMPAPKPVPPPPVPVALPKPTPPPPKVMPVPPPAPYVPPPQMVAEKPTLPPVPVPTQPAVPVFTVFPDEAFPYKKTVVDGTEMLHPHLTKEKNQAPLPAPPLPDAKQIVSIKDTDVTEHLPALRIMPRTPEDLQTQHKGPIIRFG